MTVPEHVEVEVQLLPSSVTVAAHHIHKQEINMLRPWWE